MRASKLPRSTAVLFAALLVGSTLAAGPTTQPARRVVEGDEPDVLPSPAGVAPLNEGERTNIAARGAKAAFALYVLSPLHGAFTSTPSPTLYYYVTASTDDGIDVVVTQRGDDVGAKPIAKLPLDGVKAGLHELNLADLGAKLLPDKTYTFTVIARDPNATNAAPVQAMSLIHYRPPAAVPGPSDAESFARQGYWYDVVSDLTQRAKDDPGAARWRERLLMQDHVFGAKGQASADEAALLAELRNATLIVDRVPDM